MHEHRSLFVCACLVRAPGTSQNPHVMAPRNLCVHAARRLITVTQCRHPQTPRGDRLPERKKHMHLPPPHARFFFSKLGAGGCNQATKCATTQLATASSYTNLFNKPQRVTMQQQRSKGCYGAWRKHHSFMQRICVTRLALPTPRHRSCSVDCSALCAVHKQPTCNTAARRGTSTFAAPEHSRWVLAGIGRST